MGVFVAFDEGESARHAKALIRRVAPDELCDTELYRLDRLAATYSDNSVTYSGSEADLFIIALRAGYNLTQPVRTWLSSLLTLRDCDQEGALVVLLSGAKSHPDANAELLAYLETLAILGHLDFFAVRMESKVASVTGLAPVPEANIAEFTTTIHAPDALRGWGINE